jgi:quercetin dioxygenase-like cupin family protein
MQMVGGFQLARKTPIGEIGGLDTDVIIVDDELKPDTAMNKVQTRLDGDKVDFVVGPISPYFFVTAANNFGAPAGAVATRNLEETMKSETAGVTKAGTGIDGIVWNVLGQTYIPKQLSDNSFSWHATFPPGTFVPPHIHHTQDEYIYMLEGRFDLVLDGKDFLATSGDLIRLPLGVPHGIFNKIEQVAKCMFWVTPTRKLYDLFWAIHSMKEQVPAEVMALAARYEVSFLPPPA